MAQAKIRLDKGGLGAILKSGEVASAVRGMAETVASYAEGEHAHGGEEIPVRVDTYTTDRAAAGVTLAHPAGLPKEAKYGILTGAAASAGLEVRPRSVR